MAVDSSAPCLVRRRLAAAKKSALSGDRGWRDARSAAAAAASASVWRAGGTELDAIVSDSRLDVELLPAVVVVDAVYPNHAAGSDLIGFGGISTPKVCSVEAEQIVRRTRIFSRPL